MKEVYARFNRVPRLVSTPRPKIPALLYPRIRSYILTLYRLRSIRHERTFILLNLLLFLSLTLIPLTLLGKITLPLFYFLLPLILTPPILLLRTHHGTPITTPTNDTPPPTNNPLTIEITLPPEILTHLQTHHIDPTNPEAVKSFILDCLSDNI